MLSFFSKFFNSIFLSLSLIFFVNFSLIFLTYFTLLGNIQNDSKKILTLIFVIFGILNFIIFLSITKKLYPLTSLRKKVALLGDGQFDFQCCENNRKDEINLLANEFRVSAKKLQEKIEFKNREILNFALVNLILDCQKNSSDFVFQGEDEICFLCKNEDFEDFTSQIKSSFEITKFVANCHNLLLTCDTFENKHRICLKVDI